MTDDTRAEFERWAHTNKWRANLMRDGFGDYCRMRASVMWDAWQAAVTAERTRCAAIARKHGAEDAAREMES